MGLAARHAAVTNDQLATSTAGANRQHAAERQSKSPNPTGTSPTKRNKPCQQCQKLKVKCEHSPSGGPCLRCQAQNKECTYRDAPNKKRKKDPDERIDELEKTLASMRKSLGGYKPVVQNVETTSPVADTTTVNAGFASNFGHPLDMLARTAASSHAPDIDRFNARNTFPNADPPTSQQPRAAPRVIGPSESITTTWSADLLGIDPIKRGWLDIDDAKFLFERFWKYMIPTMPIIQLGPNPKFEEIRRQEPVLFLTIMAASASTSTIPDLFEKLQKEAVSIITYNAVVEGTKSSELLISLLILTFWPMAPSRSQMPCHSGSDYRFDQLKSYLQCQMTVAMAIDLGLQRSAKETKNVGSKLFPEDEPPNFLRPLERERTWLAVYLATTGFSVGLRRPQILEWTPHHSYCCQVLQEAGQVNDLRLVRIVQMLKLAQDFSRTFCYDTRPKKLSDPSVYLAVKGYRQQLETWRDQNPTLDEYESFWYHLTTVCLHEVSLHSFHSTEDLRPPFGFNVRVDLTPSIADPLVSTAHIDCISKVVYSAQKCLDLLVGMHFRDDGKSELPNLPTVIFARSLYAWITLVRVAAVGNSVCEEGSLKIEEYLQKVGQVLDEAASIHHFHTAMTFSWILRILKQGYKHRRGVPGILPTPFASQQSQLCFPTPSQISIVEPPAPQSSGLESTSGSASTLPPLQPEFAAELDVNPATAEMSTVGDGFDGFDWDALMNGGELWKNLGGGWSEFIFEDQSPR